MDAAASVRCKSHGRKRLQRTAKSCGPGAATVASSWRADPAGDGGKKRRSPGRARISRKTIARGKPGCPGCTCSLKPVCFLSLLSHMGLRAQSAPGFPCVLFKERDNEIAKLGQIMSRDRWFTFACARSCDLELPQCFPHIRPATAAETCHDVARGLHQPRLFSQ